MDQSAALRRREIGVRLTSGRPNLWRGNRGGPRHGPENRWCLPGMEIDTATPPPISGDATKDGWCRRRPVKPLLIGRRFDSVRRPPIRGNSSVEERNLAKVEAAGSFPASRSTSPQKLT